jgi:hypothetical protein
LQLPDGCRVNPKRGKVFSRGVGELVLIRPRRWLRS